MHTLERGVLLWTGLCTVLGGFLSVPAQAADSSLWEPVFIDEFEGSAINRSKWTFEVNCDGGGNEEDQCYVDDGETLTVSNGLLSIRAIGNYAGSNGKAVRSARITTTNSMLFKFGRFESRMKLPTGNLLWPAWWLISYNGVHGGWPRSGEIDIVEFQTQMPTKNFNTLHFGLPVPNNNYEGTGAKDLGANLSSTFYNYALEWDPQEIRWYFEDKIIHRASLDRWFLAADGNHAASYQRGSPFGAQIDSPMTMILNLAVGGNFFNSFLPPGTTSNHATPSDYGTWTPFLIDYIRVYKSKSALPAYPKAPSGDQTCGVIRSASSSLVQSSIDYLCSSQNTACPVNCSALSSVQTVYDSADKLYASYFECASKTQSASNACNFGGTGRLISVTKTSSTTNNTSGTNTAQACRAKADASSSSIESALSWVCSSSNTACRVDCSVKSTETNIIARATRIYNAYFACASSLQSASDACNFGGTAELVTVNVPNGSVCKAKSGSSESILGSSITWACSSSNIYCPLDCEKLFQNASALLDRASLVYSSYFQCASKIQLAASACDFGGTGQLVSNTTKTSTCKPNPSASQSALESAVAWACSSSNTACPLDCTQLTQSAQTVTEKATIVYAAYFKCASKLQSSLDACNFGGTGQVLVTTGTSTCVLGQANCAADEVSENNVSSGAHSVVTASSWTLLAVFVLAIIPV